MDYETLLYERDDHVVTLTYNRPDQHNAINRTMNRELHDAWQRFRDDGYSQSNTEDEHFKERLAAKKS